MIWMLSCALEDWCLVICLVYECFILLYICLKKIPSDVRNPENLFSFICRKGSPVKRAENSVFSSWKRRTPLAFCICKELWSRWHLHCLDMTWHRIDIDTAVLSTEEAHRLHKRSWAGHRQWMKMEEKRRSETIAHGQNSAVPRERYYVIFSFKKQDRKTRETMMLMPSSDAASFYSELTHSERPPRRMNFGIWAWISACTALRMAKNWRTVDWNF